MGISKASASRCVHDVAECLCEFAQDWIKLPTASGDRNVMYSSFCSDFKNGSKQNQRKNDKGSQRSIVNICILYCK